MEHLDRVKNDFLCTSMQDAWADYETVLLGRRELWWDMVVLTASNREQAQAYRIQLKERERRYKLPPAAVFVVLADPEDKRVGSGGATLNVLRYLADLFPGRDPFKGKKILVIHSGGDSKRVPQYSAVGKLFSPVPRTLPDGRPSTLFDEYMVGMSGVAARMREGMLVLSGDVLLMLNPRQLELEGSDALAISVKAEVELAKNHGVFQSKNGFVTRFLHKQSADDLRTLCQADGQPDVDLDTGAVLLAPPVLRALYSLISTNGRTDAAKLAQFVNDQARLSFYGDFLYPLAQDSTLNEYYNQAPEGALTPELHECRTQLWQVLSPFRLRLARPAPARFFHFGTTAQLVQLFDQAQRSYRGLGWQMQVASLVENGIFASAYNALCDANTPLQGMAFVENCHLENCDIGMSVSVSGVHMVGKRVPHGTVLHGLPLLGGGFVVRVYGMESNAKDTLNDDPCFVAGTLKQFMKKNHITVSDLWEGKDHSLWTARLYPVYETEEEAVEAACEMACGRVSEDWHTRPRVSLAESFNRADVAAVLERQNRLQETICVRQYCLELEAGQSEEIAHELLGNRKLNAHLFDELMHQADRGSFRLKIRIYHALSAWMLDQCAAFGHLTGGELRDRCYAEIARAVYEASAQNLPRAEMVTRLPGARVELPVRVNWGGGWTDTPPYCMEQGGAVLNAALKLNGAYPICAAVTRLDRPVIELESVDGNAREVFDRVEPLQSCCDMTDPLALHKAALLACGLILPTGGDLTEVLARTGGGFCLTTTVRGVPKGSGLGTSSILIGACVKALFEFLGQTQSDDALYARISCAEQLMSTGGGWQDQVGAMTPGVKFTTTQPGTKQTLCVEQLALSAATKKKLEERFALIYTGQRRLARNLLRDVVGRYISAQPEALDALAQMRTVAEQMRDALQAGKIDKLARLFDAHWALSKQLDPDTTNTCIEAILRACSPLIDGRFIAGAGGGGFVQVILKKGVTKAQLADCLNEVFRDSGVCLWDCSFDW